MHRLNLRRVDARPSQILHASKGRSLAYVSDVKTQWFAGITELLPPLSPAAMLAIELLAFLIEVAQSRQTSNLLAG